MNQKILTTLYLIFALVLPWSLAAMQISLGLILFYNLILAVKNRELPFLKHPFFIFVSVYLFFSFLSALFSPDAGRSLRATVDTQWVLLLLPLLVFTKIDEGDLKLIMNTLIFSASLAAIYGIIQSISGYDVIRGQNLAGIGNFYRATGGYNFYLTFAGNQMLVFFPAFYLFIREKKWDRYKIILLTGVVLIFLSIVATFARSVWLALIFVLIAGLAMSGKKLFIKSIVPVVLLIVIVAVLFPEIPQRFLSSFNLAQNETRITIWKTALNMIADKPVFGIGSGFFTEKFDHYKTPGYYDTSTHAHNDYLNIAANNGILAAIAWMAMWGVWFFFILKRLRRNGISDFSKNLLTGIALAVAGILLAAFFQCYYTDLENNIMWIFLTGLGIQLFRQEQPENTS